MGNRQKRKKRRENKKRVENFSDSQKMENNDKGLKEDNEQRRSSRSGAMLAIVAVIGALCSLVFGVCKKATNLWTVQGISYYCIQIMTYLVCATVVILSVRMVIYIVTDLLRYNLTSSGYQEFDEKSDVEYSKFIFECEYHIGFLLIMLVFVVCVLSFSDSEVRYLERGALLCSLIGLVFIGIKLVKGKVVRRIMKILSHLGLWFVVGFLVWTCTLVLATSQNGIAEIRFFEDGSIEISNSAAKTMDMMIVEIVNENNESIFYREMSGEEMLYAIERVDYYQKGDGINSIDIRKINTELQHWKSLVNIDSIINENGQYRVYIQIITGKKVVRVRNTCIKEGNNYEYAVENISKEY